MRLSALISELSGIMVENGDIEIHVPLNSAEMSDVFMIDPGIDILEIDQGGTEKMAVIISKNFVKEQMKKRKEEKKKQLRLLNGDRHDKNPT